MSNSPLVVYTALSPNHSGQRNHAIDTITPHYMGGNCTVEVCGQIFAPRSRQASSNYGIGSDGRVAMYVEERNRAWTSGNGANDNRAVTIECANLADGSLTAKCWNALVALCADICRRNGKTRLVYNGRHDYAGVGKTDMLLTMHKWFQDTDCPGPWLSKQFGRLANEVNKALGGGSTPIAPATPAAKTAGKGFGGMYRCTVGKLNVRTAPSLSGAVVASYSKGQTVTLDDWYTSADGYIWGRYTGANSGKLRYVAVGRATGKVEPDDYLVRV